MNPLPDPPRRQRRILRPSYSAPGALLLRARAAAQLLDVSRSTFHKLRRLGCIPLPALRAGGIVRWSASELARWADSGCPDAATWQRMQTQQTTGPRIAS